MVKHEVNFRIDMCFYVQHHANVLYILVCIFMTGKFLTVINKTLKTRRHSFKLKQRIRKIRYDR